MSFVKSKGFKYFKNFIIGAGAAVVLVGALFKIQSKEGADEMLTVGMLTEAGIFLMLGLLGPEPDYYWHKLYPGLENYNGEMEPLTSGGVSSGPKAVFNSEKLESGQAAMLAELQVMSKSLSSLKALQEIDFSGTSDQIKKMGQFYSNLNEAMANINDSIEDTRVYKEQLSALNQNLGSLNSVYGKMLTAMGSIGVKP